MRLSALTSEELFASLKSHVASEHRESVCVIAHLTEVARRHDHIRAGCRSLAVYCEELLGISPADAGRRVTVAYIVLDYPAVLGMLERKELCLSALLVLRPALTRENYEERLQAAAGKSVSQVELLVAGWKPKPWVTTKVFAIKTDDAQTAARAGD